MWFCKYRPDPMGKWVAKRLGKHDGFNPKRPPRNPPQHIQDLRDELAEIELRAKLGIAAAPARDKSLSTYLGEFLAAYKVGHDSGTVKQMDRHIRTFKKFAGSVGVKSVQGVTPVHCRRYLELRAAAGTGHGTLITERSYLSGIWSQAVRDGLMTANPWQGIKPPGKKPDLDWTFWSGEEVSMIAKHCVKPWQSDLVLVLANTGIRIAAALAMRWDWIGWDKGILTVPASASKSGRSYSVPMTATARDLLQRRQFEVDSPLVFPNPHGGKVVPYDSARAAIMRAIARAGVKPGTPHDLRHTYARWLVRQPGITLPMVQAALGHSSLVMTQRYLSTSAEENAETFAGLRMGEGQS